MIERVSEVRDGRLVELEVKDECERLRDRLLLRLRLLLVRLRFHDYDDVIEQNHRAGDWRFLGNISSDFAHAH